MTSRFTGKKLQGGFSLVELMIALTLGLIVIGAVTGVFLSSNRNYAQDELVSRMQENARYALHVLSQDLAMAGYWGPLTSGQDINVTPGDCTSPPTSRNCQGFYQDSSLSVGTDCTPGMESPPPTHWAIDIDHPIEFFPQVATGTAAHGDYDCIDATKFENGSDILAIKRTDGEKLKSTRNASADDGDIFIRTDGVDSMLFLYDTGLDVSESPSASDWRYLANIYYIRNYFVKAGDGIPTLVRKKLDGNNMVTEAGGVAQGIEYFHVTFGIDTDNDATANLYKPDPSLSELAKVTSAHIYVLARSISPDPDYVNDKKYQLGDVTKDFSSAPDHFYRRVFTTTVALPNTRNRILTTGG